MAKHHARGVTLEDLLKPGQKIEQDPKVTWVARTSMPKIKPIKTSDPVLFLRAVASLKESYPNLPIYIFKVEKE
jgi:hypothetical protein